MTRAPWDEYLAHVIISAGFWYSIRADAGGKRAVNLVIASRTTRRAQSRVRVYRLALYELRRHVMP